MKVTERAPYALTLVVETEQKIYIGTYESTREGRILLRDGSIQHIDAGADRERLIRKVVRGGITPEHAFLAVPADDVLRVRRLEVL